MQNFFANMRVKLLAAFLIILCLAIISTGAISYFTAKKAVGEEMFSGIDERMRILDSIISETIAMKKIDIDYLSEQIDAQLYKEDSALLWEKLDEYAQMHQEAENIFVGTEAGQFFVEPKMDVTEDYDPRERIWYTEAMKNKGELIVSEPYMSAFSDDMLITVSKTVKDGSGVVAVNMLLSYIQELTEQAKVGEKGYVVLLDKNKQFLVHPTEKAGSTATAAFYEEMYNQDKGTYEFTEQGKKMLMRYGTNGTTGWKIGAVIDTSEVRTTAIPILKTTLLVNVAALLLGTVSVYFLIRSVMRPIVSLQQKALTVSEGDLTEDVEVLSNDEIGKLGIAFNTMQKNLRKLVEHVNRNAEQVAAAAEQLAASSEQTTAATEFVSQNIEKVASGVEQQTSGVASTAQSLNEISKGIQLISESSMKVSELAAGGIRMAEQGGQAVSQTVEQMNSIYDSVSESNKTIKTLFESSKQVSSILSVITDIAEQTNLLSLNAAIEAARAGEHGKGFAVVAKEVRKLADQSRQSVKEIDEIIKGIEKDTEQSVQIMDRVTEDVQHGVTVSTEAIEQFQQIVRGIQEVNPRVEEISETIQEIATAIQEATSAANELAHIANENAAASESVVASVEEQLASMEEISSAAQDLARMAEDLQSASAQFKY